MAERAAGAPAGERLRRLLLVVPYAIGHPGTSLRDLSSTFDIPPEDLERDIGILGVTGTPPYGGGDLIDAWVDDGVVSIAMAPHLERPLRLTRPEGLALYLRVTELVSLLPGPESIALRSAQAKLLRALGGDAADAVAGSVGVAAVDVPPALAALRQAVSGRGRISIRYHAASTGETQVRTIDPEAVFERAGAWYVVAWDHLRDEERTFRADRVLGVEPTGETFVPRGLTGAERELYTPGTDDVEVRLLLRPAARWVADYYLTTDRRESDDGLEVAFPAGRLGWVERLLLRLGGDADVLAPGGLRDRVAVLAGAVLARYR